MSGFAKIQPPLAPPEYRRGARAALAVAIALACGIRTPRALGQWLDYAANPQRNAVADTGPQNVDALLWQTSVDTGGATIRFEGQTAPAVHGGRVFAHARVMSGTTHVANRLIAFDQSNGQMLHQTQIDKSLLESWASPVVDPASGVVLVCSGSKVYAINAAAGGIAWSLLCAHPVVNVAPAITRDTNPMRALVADYDPFGGDGRLYCINLAPFHAATNPFLPGDLVWEEVLGDTIGQTVAYAGGVAYVASRAGSAGTGTVYAFDIDAPPGSRLLWATAIGEEVDGGVCHSNGSVYVATYDFFGGGDNSLLAKLDAASGAIQWTVPCERTNSIPIVAGNRIYLSAGLGGFGSVPKIQCFRDDGASAVKLWDTHADTGGALAVGGWTLQPVLVGDTLYAGRIPAGASTSLPYTDLLLLDVTKTPGAPGFVRQQRAGVGSSPALSDGRLYSIGPGGLGALAACADFSGDGGTDGDDIQGFVTARQAAPPTAQQKALADLNTNGAIDGGDATFFIAKLLAP